jgi:hypothetical protein
VVFATLRAIYEADEVIAASMRDASGQSS